MKICIVFWGRRKTEFIGRMGGLASILVVDLFVSHLYLKAFETSGFHRGCSDAPPPSLPIGDFFFLYRYVGLGLGLLKYRALGKVYDMEFLFANV